MKAYYFILALMFVSLSHCARSCPRGEVTLCCTFSYGGQVRVCQDNNNEETSFKELFLQSPNQRRKYKNLYSNERRSSAVFCCRRLFQSSMRWFSFHPVLKDIYLDVVMMNLSSLRGMLKEADNSFHSCEIKDREQILKSSFFMESPELKVQI
ncbi:hypothetical protein BD770DRAFT_411346 [Pilaira anomala]|nr:hypothetical protein BD770DRAFT_411346 [Pilaira anomala]